MRTSIDYSTMILFKQVAFAAVLCVFGANALAQSESILKVSLTDPLSGRYGMGLEKSIGNRLSVAVEMDYLSKEVFLESDHPWYVPLTVRKEGFVVEPQVRFYRGEALSGTYASLSGVFGFAEYTTETGFIDNSDWSSVGASFHIGHQLRLGSVVLDGYAGCTLDHITSPRRCFHRQAACVSQEVFDLAFAEVFGNGAKQRIESLFD